MVLGKKINANSIAEVVIALAVIAMCFTVASLVFIRSIKGTIKFNDFRKQTEVQSKMFDMMLNQADEIQVDEMNIETEPSEMDSVKVYIIKGLDETVIWKQEWLQEK